jgi:hypothetical protein
MNTILIDILGWLSVVLFLVAYSLVSTKKKLEGDSVIYQTMNILGGVLLVTNSFYYHALPSVGINVAWIGIAIFALTRKLNQPSIKSD